MAQDNKDNSIMAMNINKEIDLNTFTLFPKFPAEIQFKIWEWAAISEYRVVSPFSLLLQK